MPKTLTPKLFPKIYNFSVAIRKRKKTKSLKYLKSNRFPLNPTQSPILTSRKCQWLKQPLTTSLLHAPHRPGKGAEYKSWTLPPFRKANWLWEKAAHLCKKVASQLICKCIWPFFNEGANNHDFCWPYGSQWSCDVDFRWSYTPWRLTASYIFIAMS